ncbi:MAG: response regulator [SAR324 cluster bacterium]|nr:response regulator [SAR324 cluster bacterium]
MHYDASILLVDDYKFIRTILERMLHQLGYQNLCTAVDGVEALKLLRSQPVDLVITDYHMPEMDGISLFQSMKQEPVLAKIPVLLISGVPTEKFATQALAMGIQSTLTKPFRAEQLDQEIQSLLIQSLC